MGALTLKPSAYRFRPWEVQTRPVPDLFDYHPAGLVWGVRGSVVVRVGSAGWIRDRVRFSYDGLRRQRVVHPVVDGQPAGWAVLIHRWWSRVAGAHPVWRSGPDGPPGRLVWLTRLVGRAGGPVYTYVYGVNTRGGIIHTPFGSTGSPVVVPTRVNYEELGYLPGPSGAPGSAEFGELVVQAVRPAVPGYRPGRPAAWTWTPESVRPTRPVLQVSPLQRLLTDTST